MDSAPSVMDAAPTFNKNEMKLGADNNWIDGNRSANARSLKRSIKKKILSVCIFLCLYLE
jgi:hypothetical protein